MSEFKVVVASIDQAPELTTMINLAYQVEIGTEGVAFQTGWRLLDPMEDGMEAAYKENRVLLAVSNTTGEIGGVIVYEIKEDSIYFGPFAVPKASQGKGIGKFLMNEIDRLGVAHALKWVEIGVISCRTDLIPMYEYLGFEKFHEIPFPRPERATKPVSVWFYRRPVHDLFPTAASTAAPAVNPWASINDMLVANKCFLCEQMFPRGKQKRVFQVSNLVDYFSVRHKHEDGLNAPRFQSRNLQGCYEEFCRLRALDGPGMAGRGLHEVFLANDVELWMSGLVCGNTPDCIRELELFVPVPGPPPQQQPEAASPNATPAAAGAARTKGAAAGSGLFSFLGPKGRAPRADCPPDCDCDNPWAFLG